AGRAVPLAPPALQYSDFAAWQRAWLQGESLERLLAYWRERLRDAPALLELPTDRARPERLSAAGDQQALRLDGAPVPRRRVLAPRSGATLFMLTLAAFDALLARLSGQLHILVGTPVAGRDRTELTDLVGCFVNTIVLRTDLAGDPRFDELVGRVR